MDLPFSVDYQVDKMNRNNFFVVQERNIGWFFSRLIPFNPELLLHQATFPFHQATFPKIFTRLTRS